MRIILLSVLLLLISKSQAQEKVFEISMSAVDATTALFTYNSDPQSDNFTFSFFQKKEMNKYIARENGNVFAMDSVIIAKNGSQYKMPYKLSTSYIGGTITNEHLHEDIFVDANNHQLSFVTTDQNLKNIVHVETFPMSERETVGLTFTQNNVFYCLNYIPSSDKAVLYKKHVGKPFERTEKVIDLPFTGRPDPSGTYVSKFSDLFLDAYVVMDAYMENPLPLSFAKTKFYVADKQLIFTLDNDRHETWVAFMQFDDFSFQFRKFPPLTKSQALSNSMICDSLLIRIYNERDSVRFSFYDIFNGNFYKHFEFNKIDASEKEDKVYYIAESRFDTKPLRLVKNIKTLPVGISVYQADTTLAVTLAARYATANTGKVLLSSLVTVGSFALAPYSGLYLVYWNPLSLKNLSYFNFSLNTKTFEKSVSTKSSVMHHPMFTFLQQANFIDRTISCIPTKNYYYVGGYSQKDGNYSIYKFNRHNK